MEKQEGVAKLIPKYPKNLESILEGMLSFLKSSKDEEDFKEKKRTLMICFSVDKAAKEIAEKIIFLHFFYNISKN
jgi:hypothetical protein